MADKLPPELSWSDHERDQTWVPRYAETRPGERRMETAVWRYCVSRHKQRWLGTKRHRGPPLDYRHKSEEGKDFGIGWWFPTLWTKEFKPGTISAAVPVRPRPTHPMVETDWKLPWPGLEMFKRWQLPTGTIISAWNATVTYPDGTVEGWAEAARRHGKQGADMPVGEPARDDEPPPPSYE